MVKKDRKVQVIGLALVLLLPLVALVLSPNLAVQAGILPESVGATDHLYDKYALSAYSLDFWVDTSGDWLPWNWGEGIGKNVDYILCVLADFIWMIAQYLGYFLGGRVEQAYSLDFINDTVTYLGTNMQKVLGVDASGFRGHGLLPSFLPLLIILVGCYFFYLAVVKSQFTRATTTILTFLVVGVLGVGMVAYSGSYLTQINTFQQEFNQEVLAISDTLTVGDTNSGTSGIRDSLFSIMVYQPYLLLQYGTTDIEEIGQERIDNLLNATKEERENLVQAEVSDHKNESMTVGKQGERLVNAFFIVLLDLVIFFCVACLVAYMILSQVMFNVYVSFLPVVLVFALFPNNTRNLTSYLRKLFGVLMNKAGITLILSVVFGLSTVAYRLAGTHSFLWTMFLQVVIYVGALMKSSELLGFMSIRGDGEDRAVKRVGGRLSTMISGFMLGHRLKKGGGVPVADSPGNNIKPNPAQVAGGGFGGGSTRRSRQNNNRTSGSGYQTAPGDNAAAGNTPGQTQQKGTEPQSLNTRMPDRDLKGRLENQMETGQRPRNIRQDNRTLEKNDPYAGGLAQDERTEPFAGHEDRPNPENRQGLKSQRNQPGRSAEHQQDASQIRRVETHKKGGVSGSNFNNFENNSYDVSKVASALLMHDMYGAEYRKEDLS